MLKTLCVDLVSHVLSVLIEKGGDGVCDGGALHRWQKKPEKCQIPMLNTGRTPSTSPQAQEGTLMKSSVILFARMPRTPFSISRGLVNWPWLAYCLVALATAVASRTVSAGLVLNIDTTSKLVYLTGSDTGSSDEELNDPTNPSFGSMYSIQFIHFFATNALSASGGIAPSIASFFEGGAGLYGSLSAYDNQYGADYVFMDITSYSYNITALTGSGPSAALSYASVPQGAMLGFESLIGKTMGRTLGTGWSSISVVSTIPAASSVPEVDPATGSSALSLVAGVLAMVEQRRRRSLKAVLVG